MLNTRNIRLLLSVVVIFTIVGFFASSRSSLSSGVQNVKLPLNGESVPFSNEHADEETKNTLKGKPHSSSSPPYSQDDAAAPVVGGNTGSGAGSASGSGSSKAGSADKPKFVADKSSSETEHKKNKDKAAAAANAAAGLGGSGAEMSVQDVTDNTAACDKKEFVVMIDAGSTGSRVHVYEFNTCVSPPALLNEKFDMLKPGLSSFDTDTKGAAASLDPLLEVALKTVPKDKQACTPIAVKATAGLRLLGEEKSSKILAEVRSHLEKDYPFAVVSGDGISIMDGLNEGVYAWITTNYLLGNIGSAEKLPTAAVFDLGGGSTQIVFEPEFPNNEKMADGEHKFEITFGGRKFTLYQFSHLGYGLMQGRNKVNALILESALKNEDTAQKLAGAKVADKNAAKTTKAEIIVHNPCIPPGVVASNVQVELTNGDIYVVNMKGPSSSAGSATCRGITEAILNKGLECKQKPCSFNGVHQPSLTKTFKHTSDMYVFSYFYDRTNPIGLPSSFSMEELSDLAKLVCNGDTFWKELLLDDHIKQLNDEPQWCLDLTFMSSLLHTGYDLPLHRELRTAKTIDNNELGWCLGASLPLLDKKEGGWKCRVDEVK